MRAVNATPTGKGTKASTAKTTPQQKHGLRLLQAAQAEAAGLQPDMRTFVLWQIAHGYRNIEPARTDSLLASAFRVSQSIEQTVDEPEICMPLSRCDVKGTLQLQILREVVERSPDRIASLLPRAEPEVRKDVTERLILHYAERKDFDRAKQLLNQFAEDDDYPFPSASHLMRTLPEDRAADRLAIFSQALNNFQQHMTHSIGSRGDFAAMVVEFSQQLPPAMVMDAVDTILEKAKDKDDPMVRARIGISGKKGAVDFSNVYEYRLFELLPIIEKLDKTKAESLLRDDSTARSLLDQYPEGLQSLTGEPKADDPMHGTTSMYIAAATDAAQGPSIPARMQMENEIDRRLQEIAAETVSNPKQALADALSLPQVGAWGPDSCPRLMGLQEIATNLADRDPAAAKSALDEELKLWDVLPDSAAADMLAEAAESYRRLGDQDNAQKTLRQAMKAAERLYAEDEHEQDPDRRFKGGWNSTRVWQHIVAAAGRISNSLAEQVLREIPDPEIAVFEKVAYADSLLGVVPYRY